MIKFLFAGIGILWLLTFSACNPAYYYPTTQNIGAVKDKGDVYASIGLDAEQQAFAAGYAFTDNIGLIGTYRVFDQQQDREPNYQAYFVEPELVLTERFKRSNDSPTNFFGSVHIGYGGGQLARHQNYFSLAISRFFLQPGVFYSNHIFDAGLSMRISRADYSFKQLQPFNGPPNVTLRDEYNLGTVGEHPYYFLEPAVTLGAGYKYVKLRAQLIFITPLSKADMNIIEAGLIVSANFFLNTRKKE